MKRPGRRMLRGALGACALGFAAGAALASEPAPKPGAAQTMPAAAVEATAEPMPQPEPSPLPAAPESPPAPDAAADDPPPLQPLAPQPEQPIGTPPRSQVVTIDYDIAVPGAGAVEAPEAPQEDGERAVFERGTASWYGLQFHQRKTASGERFDMDALTAAHRTLPFGTRVCVRSLVNGREVLVRINDRGPFTPGRIIDLSRAAADAIGMTGLGIKEVALSIVDDEGMRCGAEQAAPSPTPSAPGR